MSFECLLRDGKDGKEPGSLLEQITQTALHRVNCRHASWLRLFLEVGAGDEGQHTKPRWVVFFNKNHRSIGYPRLIHTHTIPYQDELFFQLCQA